MRFSTLLTLFASAVPVALACGRPGLAGVAPAGVRAGTPTVDTLTLRAAASFLASDALRGRGTGTEGGRAAAAYLAAECRRLGLAPLTDTGYAQDLPLTQATIVPEATTVRITGPGVDTTFVHWEDFIPDVGTGQTLRGFSGELAYVGRAQEILFRRSDLPPLQGKVALLRSEFGRDGEAADTLFARGAVGVIQVIDDARRYRLFRQTRGESRLYLSDPTVRSSFIPPLPSVLAGPRMTVTLYQPLTGVGSGSWNDAYLNGLAAGLPSPRELPGWRAEVKVGTRTRPAHASNVACVLPGRDAEAGRAIVVSAHYDHLGTGAPNADGDSIYNGFSDNAAGVAMALGIGEAFARERRARDGGGLRHSLILFFSTGEEHGLLGSDYFVTHPLWPLRRVAGVINLDAIAPAARPRSWRIAGEEGSALVELVRQEAAREGWEATLAQPSPGSDYYPFVRHGVPAVFFVPGDGPYEGLSVTTSDSLRSALWGRYHMPNDEWDEHFPFEGLGRYADFAIEVIRRRDASCRAEGCKRATAYRPSSGMSRTGPGGSR
ncbi:MAG TPA: M28 family peptidase [Gemmatimonadales bacterium]|nr:M28 family peptidase [Gemmatimonadales bacterium]